MFFYQHGSALLRCWRWSLAEQLPSQCGLCFHFAIKCIVNLLHLDHVGAARAAKVTQTHGASVVLLACNMKPLVLGII